VRTLRRRAIELLHDERESHGEAALRSEDVCRRLTEEGWEVDRLLYEYPDHFLADISASEGHRDLSGSRA
jgi:hypothetical protein